ncbi:hypothetical protein BCR34DRAFT_620222 [Clohesyomyces aquaticus]|uniref:ASX DEUBAD domain-containing protein n=1 Tax=Clohesyomyces aquaticus TaxID=1231657 RepID=A0A1Y1Y7Y6_9PLEO|nr:hypothetical protein BCR34DRAFT_620222 [Clohesyomyces aquaticus]
MTDSPDELRNTGMLIRRQPLRRKAKEPTTVPNTLPATRPKKEVEKPNPKQKTKTFDPTYMTTNSRSKLASEGLDIYHLLTKYLAWDILSPDQQAKLLKLLPQFAANLELQEQLKAGGTKVPRAKELSLGFSPFKTDDKAEKAYMARAEGEFDEWKEKEAELWWGQK